MNLQKKNYLTFCKILFDKNNEAQKLKNIELFKPSFDRNKKIFVEPYLPNYQIGIMHLAAGIWNDDQDMRVNKDVKIKIQSLNNNYLEKSLRFGL